MKQTITLLSFLTLLSFNCFSQDLVGRRIINGNLNFNFVSVQDINQNSFTSNLGLLYGTIKKDNTYLALGGVIGLSNYTTNNGQFVRYTNAQIQVGPSVGYGKFIPLVNKFYYAPSLSGNISGYFGDSNGVGANISVSPLRFMYHFAENFMLTAELGSAGLTFQQINNTTILNLSSSIANSTGIGVFYTFKPKD